MKLFSKRLPFPSLIFQVKVSFKFIYSQSSNFCFYIESASKHSVILSIISQVNALIEEETRRYRPTKNYLEYLPDPKFSAFEVRYIIYSFL